MASKTPEKNKTEITSKQMKKLLKERELRKKIKHSLIDKSKNKKVTDENIEFLLKRL